MFKRYLAVPLIAVAFTVTGVAWGATTTTIQTGGVVTHQVLQSKCNGDQTPFRFFASEVWNYDRWNRGAPHHRAIASYHERLACANKKSQSKLNSRWSKDRFNYGQYRLYRIYAPEPGPANGRHHPSGPEDLEYTALPAFVPCGESGDTFHQFSSGMYGDLQSTWEAYGGLKYGPTPGSASALDQTIFNRRLVEQVGIGGWAWQQDAAKVGC